MLISIFLPSSFNLYLYLLIVTMATLLNPQFSSCLCEHPGFNELLSFYLLHIRFPRRLNPETISEINTAD